MTSFQIRELKIEAITKGVAKKPRAIFRAAPDRRSFFQHLAGLSRDTDKRFDSSVSAMGQFYDPCRR